jgi:hypothetical protein
MGVKERTTDWLRFQDVGFIDILATYYYWSLSSWNVNFWPLWAAKETGRRRQRVCVRIRFPCAFRIKHDGQK